MKYVFSLLAILVFSSFTLVGDIYNIAVKNIDGGKIDFNQFKGKKMLFIILPTSTTDTTVAIDQIIKLQTKYQSSLVIIGIPSEDDGYQPTDAARFKKMYKDAAANFTIGESMKVKKGNRQSSLFQWLTSKDQNHHFDQDVQGVGSKFFVDEGGELYAVMGPQLKLSNPLIDRIVTRQQGKRQ